MKSSAKRLYGIFLSLFILIVSLVGYTSMLVPKYEDIQELRGERDSLNALVQNERASIEAVKVLIKEHTSASNLGDSLSVALPDEESVASAVNQIRGIAESNGMLMVSFTLKPLTVDARAIDSIVRPVATIRMSIDLLGDYESLQLYLRALETNVRLMDIQSINVGKGGTDGPYEYQIEVDTYHQI
jgi:Tfp pilus assembly protein PilO